MQTRQRSRRAAAAAAWTALLLALGAGPAQAIPSFARQTKLPCSACHTQFPELNAFGRVFKLNGYTLRMIETIESSDTTGHQDLSINLMPLPSVMVQASETYTARPQPGTTNGTVALPQQLSVFLAGAITPKIGAFVQLTYDAQSGSMHLDNTSLRFATQGSLFAQPTTFGLSLNNNPTLQDLWNSTPAWGFPYVSSSVAPGAAGSTLIDGTLAQEVAGLSGYLYWNSAVYAEVGVYRSAPVGTTQPFDSTASGIIDGLAPYWRVAYTRSFGDSYLEVGTYGMTARRQPGSFVSGGSTDTYTDLALDFEFMRPFGRNELTVTGTWIHEMRSLDASVAAGLASVASQSVNEVRVRGTYHAGQGWAYSLMPFFTTGTTDPTLYPSGAVTGSLAGSPNTTGLVAEVDYNPWQNARITLQYTAYGKFNGRANNYDGANRNASDNNHLYLVTWLMF